MVLCLTGAGISSASGIPTFEEQPGVRYYLTRSFANRNPEKFREVVEQMQATCEAAKPNDAHIALGEYAVPIITMNVDGLHRRAGSKHVLPIHGELPNIVLYGDPAPLYQDASAWVYQLDKGDVFLIVGTSYYTTISVRLKEIAVCAGATVVEINNHAETRVREFLETTRTCPCSFEEFLARDMT